MLSPECLGELRTTWLPNITDAGLERLIDLLEKGSPLLVHGCFTRAVPMGCLATHVAWNHPQTSHLTLDAGITWLHRVAGLNPATSEVLRAWDQQGVHDLELRGDLLRELRGERIVRKQRRQFGSAPEGDRHGLKDDRMLPRILEPEVMDTPEEARDYDAMDHSGVNGLFVADFLAAWDGRNPILDVGTGTAQIPIALCLRHPTARVTAIDLADHMLQVGRDNVERAGFADRIMLQRLDAKALPFARGSFAAIMSNSIVHHIPEPAAVLAEMVRVLRAGGCLLVRDLLRPSDDGEVNRLVELYAAGANAHQRKMFDDSLRAALTLHEVRALILPLGFAPETVQATSDRHWTWSARKPIVF